MLDIQTFNAIPAGEIIAHGPIKDGPDGCNMTGSGWMLRFVAVKGYANDWAVYVHHTHWTIQMVRENGDKVVGRGNIMACVPCSEEVFGHYRY